jgi:hypothetical protein
MGTNGSAHKRVALVIGNGSYQFAPPLANAIKDAEAVAGAFERLGFSKVVLRRDADQSQLSQALADFSESSADADIAVAYFAGHGIEVDGENYLLPVGTEISHVNRVRFETQPLSSIVSSVAGAKTLGLVIVDACRDNPFRSRMKGIENTRSASSRGLALVEPFGNTLVAYAAKHGTLARDGDSQAHSPFTRALLDYLERPDIELRLLFGKVRDAVLDATGRQQEPHLYGSLGGREIFLKTSTAPSVGGDVFISYARKDKDSVARIAQILQSEGMDVFWDQDLVVGDDWRDVIKNRLSRAKCVVAVWSEDSINSDWVKWEAARGYDRGILIPLTIDGKSPARVFDEIQTADLSNWDGSPGDARVARLLTGIRTILERAKTTAAPEPRAAIVTSAPAAETFRAPILQPVASAPVVPPSQRGMSAGGIVGAAAVVLIGVGISALALSGKLGDLFTSTSRPTEPPVTAATAPTPPPPPQVIEKVIEKPVYIERPAPPPIVIEKPVYIERPAPTPPTPPQTASEPATPRGASKLEFNDCAIVLEAVKTCETLRDCSDSSIQDNFTTGEREHFDSINGRAVFTTAKFYSHCKDVCRRHNYALHPARDILCGY